MKKFLFFETEIDGLPIKWPPKKGLRKPQIIRLTWGIYDEEGKLIKAKDQLIHRKGGLLIQTQKITGISNHLLNLHGHDLSLSLTEFMEDLQQSNTLVSYNLNFEIGNLENELGKDFIAKALVKKDLHCLMKEALVVEINQSNRAQLYLSFSELYFSAFGSGLNRERTPYSEVNAMAQYFFRK